MSYKKFSTFVSNLNDNIVIAKDQNLDRKDLDFTFRFGDFVNKT